MREALKEAEKAFEIGEVPVGAVIERHGQIIGRGHNRTETRKDPTAHAEIIAIRQAAETLGGWRLLDSNLYVTTEPCSMCAGAIVLARIKTVYKGPWTPKRSLRFLDEHTSGRKAQPQRGNSSRCFRRRMPAAYGRSFSKIYDSRRNQPKGHIRSEQ